MPPAGSSRGRVAHGSILNDNFGGCRVNSQWQSTNALEDGETRRFSQLKRAIGGVSERMLAQTLQWLEADGLVLRIAHDVVPPHVDYRLTPLGVEAAEKVRLLADWVETSLPQIAAGWADRAA